MQTTKVFDNVLEAYKDNVRYIDCCGGTRSGKTYAILQFLIIVCLYDKRPLITSVVSESIPHLKRGAIRDFQAIMEREQLWDRSRWHDGDKTYTFSNGSKLEFFSADDAGKVHGPARDRLFINEGQNIPYETARHLFVRTRGLIIIDYNPVSEFWAHRYIRNSGRSQTIHSTYLDNPYLSEEQVAEIESNRGDKEWWTVYGEGKTGRRQGLVFPHWELTNKIPADAKFLGRGLDFGYTADPTAIVDCYLLEGQLYLEERLYRKGLTNDMIAKFLKDIGGAPSLVADSAEMKSIQEIRNYGVRNIQPAIKGKGSINFGIDIMKRYPIRITRGSLNLIHEMRNYMWETDKLTGEITNKAIDKYNHAIDAARYLIVYVLAEKRAYPVPLVQTFPI